MKLKELGVTFSGLCCDSRQVQNGNLFFAIPGVQHNGHLFVADALARGATGIVYLNSETLALPKNIVAVPVSDVRRAFAEMAAEFYGHPSQHLKIIAITGTNGKTSICYLTALALNQLGKKTAMLSTLGNGFPDHLEPSELTTSDALSVQKQLAEFLKAGAEYVVMEASSHGLAQERLAGTQISIGVFTNLTRDHLDYHQTMQAYQTAKFRLFQEFELEKAVINVDDPAGKILAQKKFSYPILTYGLQAADIVPQRFTLTDQGISGELITPVGTVAFQASLVGQFNVYNFSAVVGVLLSLKFSLTEILAILAKLPRVPGRVERVVLSQGTRVFLDFAHTPDALEKVLLALKTFSTGKIFCVFGCGGNRDRGKRPMMAAISEKYADVSIVTDDNPRFESSKTIIQEVLSGFKYPERVHVEPDRVKAIQWAISEAKPEDIILLAGKGAEPYQVIGDEKIPFNELEVLKPYV